MSFRGAFEREIFWRKSMVGLCPPSLRNADIEPCWDVNYLTS